jgi:SAM-dependent methyltransferase
LLTVDFDRLDLRPGERLLDLGCGFGRHAYEGLMRGAHVVTCDLSRPELESVLGTALVLAEDGQVDTSCLVAPIQGDATRLPFADATFDKIIASEVLEHVPDDGAAFGELTRVLRPGGTLAVTVPAWLPETICWKLSSDYHAPAAEGGHVRIYTRRQLRSRLSEAGLRPGAHHHAHALHSPYWWLRCAVGPKREVEENRAVSCYHRLLEWDIVKQPLLTRSAELVLNPVLGKSLVVYASKPTVSALDGIPEVDGAA